MVWLYPTTFLLLALATENTISSSSSPQTAARVNNNHQATIWLATPGDPSKPFRFHCTGTIISRQHVLTAAICATKINKKKPLLVVSAAKDHLSESHTFSPALNASLSSQFDLAVITVKPEFFPAASVAKLLGDDIHIATDDKCIVSGWFPGSGSDLWSYEGALYLNNEDCSEIYNQLSMPFNKNHVCSIPEVGNGTCKVGVGWSLVCDEQVTGVFTWTHHSCDKPSVYISVQSAMAWITSFNGASTPIVPSVLLTLLAVAATTLRRTL